MNRILALASGRKYELPLFDPLVANHFAADHSLVDTLLEQINGGMYAELFQNKKDLTFLDIGANIGLVSLYAMDNCKRIVALEPAPDTYNVLKAMTCRVPNIEIAEFALAPVEGEVTFYENNINSTASSTVNTYGHQIKVQGLKLSDILRIYQLESVDVLKCDAEGAEGESLRFEELTAAKDIVKSYYIETHNCPHTTWKCKLHGIFGKLLDLGYYKMRVDGMALIASLP